MLLHCQCVFVCVDGFFGWIFHWHISAVFGTRCRCWYRCRSAANCLEFLISNSFDRIIIINFYLIASVLRSIAFASLCFSISYSNRSRKWNLIGSVKWQITGVRAWARVCPFWANVSGRLRWQVVYVLCVVHNICTLCGPHWALLKSQDWLTQHILSAQEQHTDQQRRQQHRQEN